MCHARTQGGGEEEEESTSYADLLDAGVLKAESGRVDGSALFHCPHGVSDWRDNEQELGLRERPGLEKDPPAVQRTVTGKQTFSGRRRFF